MLKIFANYEPSFSLTETKKEDKEYKVFLLKQEFKAEKGNQVYSPRYYEIMVELFLLGETEYLTLIWWETEDSLSRLLIMSLFMCQDGDLDTTRRIASFYIPPFALYCNRFKSDEANRRIQEIQLSQDNISNLRIQLRPVIKNSVLFAAFMIISPLHIHLKHSDPPSTALQPPQPAHTSHNRRTLCPHRRSTATPDPVSAGTGSSSDSFHRKTGW